MFWESSGVAPRPGLGLQRQTFQVFLPLIPEKSEIEFLIYSV